MLSRTVLAKRLSAGIALVAALAVSGCFGGGTNSEQAAARKFDGFPLYWVGERFEKWDLAAVDGLDGPGEFVTFVYGTCKPSGDEPSCVPPLEIQVFPLCWHLEAVARAPVWKRRRVRGAPVGASDSAPVLFTRGAQVKVYRGEGSDPGLPLRALHALRSINRVEPVVGASAPLPSPPPGVLEGTRACAS